MYVLCILQAVNRLLLPEHSRPLNSGLQKYSFRYHGTFPFIGDSSNTLEKIKALERRLNVMSSICNNYKNTRKVKKYRTFMCIKMFKPTLQETLSY